MSMTDEDVGLSAEEQAQFDAMRDTALPAGSNISSPDQLPDPSSAIDATSTAVDKVTAKAEPQTPTIEPDDPDVETVKDATGKDVIDANTGKPQRRVSFHKYQRAMERLAAAEAAVAKTSEERARIDERLKIINEALTTPGPEAAAKTPEETDPEPDPEVNIFEWVKWNKRELAREREARTNLETAWREERDDANLANNYRQDANKFAQTEPNFGPAYHYLLSVRANQLRAAGWDDETKISQQLVKEEKGLVKNAYADSVSPAARIFEMAKAAGFAPKAAAAPAAAVPGTPLGDMKPPAAAPKAGVPSVTEQVRMAAEGAAASTSLSQAGGAPLEQLTQAKLLSMDEDEFNMVVSQLSKTKLRELFGD